MVAGSPAAEARRNDDAADLEDRDVVGLRGQDLHEVGGERGARHRGAEGDLPVIHVSHVEEAVLACGAAAGLEEGGKDGSVVGDLVDLVVVVVVEDNVQGEDLLDGVDGFVGDGRHGAVADGEDGDGRAAVYVGGKVGLGEEIVEGGEVGQLGQHLGDVVGSHQGEEEGEEEGEGEGGGRCQIHGGEVLGRWRER